MIPEITMAGPQLEPDASAAALTVNDDMKGSTQHHGEGCRNAVMSDDAMSFVVLGRTVPNGRRNPRRRSIGDRVNEKEEDESGDGGGGDDLAADWGENKPPSAAPPPSQSSRIGVV
jgi:hypothetical protein